MSPNQHAERMASDLDQRLEEFTRDGYTVIPGAHDLRWVAKARASHRSTQERRRAAGGGEQWAFDDLLELDPEVALPAIMQERVLALAERIIGPHLQIESTACVGFPPAASPPPDHHDLVPGWHRDLFAIFPQSGAYHRPLLFNAMTYLQDLTDAIGPLRVVPGSHRRPYAITAEQKQRHHAEEVVLRPKAGDAVLFHNALLHTGSVNRSAEIRYFYCVTFNHCWLKFRASYGGPSCQAIIRDARERGDRRLLRLLGADEHVLTRALYHHVLEPEEQVWSQWREEDRSRPPGQAWVPVLR